MEMQPPPRPDRSYLALAAAFVLLVLAIAAVIVLNGRQRDAAAMVAHTLTVENKVTGILSRLQDAETGQRGYLLTGRDSFLEPYRESERRLESDLDALDREIADNPRQRARAAGLRRVSVERQRHLAEVIAGFRRTGTVDRDLLGVGKQLMDDIRLRVGAMKAEEDRLFAERSEASRRTAQLMMAARVVILIAIFLLGWLALRLSRVQLARAIASRDALEEANRRLVAESESRMAAEAQTRQLQKMDAVGQLTGGIAHDFNNMLAIVVGSLDIAGRRLAQGKLERAADCIDNAMEGAQRATLLTSRLLAFSRQQPLEPQPLDANKLVGGMSEMLRRTIGEAVRVETVLAGGLWRTFADPYQLESAILNLCVNARDAMPEGGKLTIETSNAHLDDAYAAGHPDLEPGQYVMISISDTGTGMSAEVIERAFDPFYTTKEVGRGTGLGLSQVFGFVKQSSGHVKIYSEPGQGTAVKIYLPRRLGEEETAAASGALSGGMEGLERAKGEEVVLVVEDEEMVRLVSVDALRELGYVVFEAADGRQALAALEAQPRVDLLFTDVVMPGMNGRQLAEEVATRRPEVKILYTTGYTRNAIVHNGMLDVGVAFLAKPFTLAQLAAKVRQVLDKREG